MTTADAARECLVEQVSKDLRISLLWAECIAGRAGKIPASLRKRLDNLRRDADAL